MNFDKYFDKIDELLKQRNHNKLSKTEKDLIVVNWQKACFEWMHSPKATQAEYAIYRQLEITLSNVIFDVLHHTRKYEKAQDNK